MRYYDIVLTTPDTNKVTGQTTTKVVRRWTSHPNGVFDPGALNIIFDMFVIDLAAGPQNSSITIEGVPIADIAQAWNWAARDPVTKLLKFNLAFSGGMQAGLPLANPAQAGLLLSGPVYQSYGNWVGTDMKLNFTVSGGGAYTLERPGNLVLIWPAGTPLSQALANMLNIAFPGVRQNINISSSIILSHDNSHVASTLHSMAAFVQETTSGLLYAEYPGVSIALQAGQLYVYDGSVVPKNVQLAFTDLVGQPTWIHQEVIQVTTVLRADIQVGNTITMPPGVQNAPGLVTATGPSLPASLAPKYQLAFQGQFVVQSVRHHGNSRAADGGEWVSQFECAPLAAAKGSAAT